MAKLLINTSNSKLVEVGVETQGKKFSKTVHQEFGSQVLLKLIEQVLEQANVKKKDLTQVIVSTGPGSYTGLRVGVAVANTLGFVLGIPVNDKEMETELKYS